MRKEKHLSCHCCGSPNCYIKQKICKRLGAKKSYIIGCPGKYAKFGDLSNYGQIKPPNKNKGKQEKNKKPEANEGEASVEKPTAEIDSEEEEIESTMKNFLDTKANTPTDVNINNIHGFMAYPVSMSIEDPSNDEGEYSGNVTIDDFDKMSQEDDTDHKCPICQKGGNWDHEDLFDHMGREHEIFYKEFTLEDLRDCEEGYIDSLQSGYDSSRSIPSSVRSLKPKYSSDDSSDSSSSHSQSGKPKVRKSWAKRNAAINDEKFKKMDDKIDNSVRQLNNSLTSLSANHINEEKLITLDRNIKTEIKHVESETKAIKNKVFAIDNSFKQSEDVLKSIDEVTQQNKSEIRSVITKMDENNDKVNILTNTIISLQATVETLQKQTNSNMTLQKPTLVENVQIPSPSGQEVQLNSTQDTIKEVSIPVVNRTSTVNDNSVSVQSKKVMTAPTAPEFEVKSNSKVIIQVILGDKSTQRSIIIDTYPENKSTQSHLDTMDSTPEDNSTKSPFDAMDSTSEDNSTQSSLNTRNSTSEDNSIQSSLDAIDSTAEDKSTQTSADDMGTLNSVQRSTIKKKCSKKNISPRRKKSMKIYNSEKSYFFGNHGPPDVLHWKHVQPPQQNNITLLCVVFPPDCLCDRFTGYTNPDLRD